MQIQLTLNGNIFIADMLDTHAVHDFIAMLPMTLELKPFGYNEQIADLSNKLDISDSPAGTIAQVGDICMYAPWGNFAMFHHAFPYSEGLIKLGHIRGDVSYWHELAPQTLVQINIVQENLEANHEPTK